MALDNAAADAAVEAYILTFSPPLTEDQKAGVRTSMQPIYRTLYAGIVANAVVSPAGSPAMTVGGTPVTGTGKVT